MTDIEEKNVSLAADQEALDPQSELLDQSLKNWDSALLTKLKDALTQLVLSDEEYERLNETLAKSLVDSVFPALLYISKHKELSVLRGDSELYPYIEQELEKPEYGGHSIPYLLEHCERDETGAPVPDSLIKRAIKNAEKARDNEELKKKRQTSIERTREQNRLALETDAITVIESPHLLFFSSKQLEDAFTPNKIYSWQGEELPRFTDDGQLITESAEDEEKIKQVYEVKVSMMALIAALFESSANLYEELVSNSSIQFSVNKVCEAIGKADPRLHSEIRGMVSQSMARVLYLERIFDQLSRYIGILPNGSRYSVLNYIGYDAETDTMEISSPYIRKLLNKVQQDYFDRQSVIKEKESTGKRILSRDRTPFEINKLFKAGVHSKDPATLEIAVYITNLMLQAGKGSDKKLVLSYKKILANCHIINAQIQRFIDEDRENKARPKEERVKLNTASNINSVLKKFTAAHKLIMDDSFCTASKRWDNIEFSPLHAESDKKTQKAGTRYLQPPTKKTLYTSKIVITWNAINNEDP